MFLDQQILKPSSEAIIKTLSAGPAPEVPFLGASPTPIEKQKPRAHSLTAGEATASLGDSDRGGAGGGGEYHEGF